MNPPSPATRIFLALGPTDLRKGIEGLSSLVQHRFKEDPLSGHWFIFTNRETNRLKLLYWDGSGFWLCTKRLEKGRFFWPKLDAMPETGALRILSEELTLIMSGLDPSKTRTRNWWRKAA